MNFDIETLKKPWVILLLVLILILGGVGIYFSQTHPFNRVAKQAKSSQTSLSSEPSSSTTKPTDTSSSLASQTFDESTVSTFITAYFNYKELGNQLDAYKPYVTDTFYALMEQNYKDPNYMRYAPSQIDMKVSNSSIYLNQKNLSAIVYVHSTYTQINNTPTGKSEMKNMPLDETFLIQYQLTDFGYLVNTVTPITLTYVGGKAIYE